MFHYLFVVRSLVTSPNSFSLFQFRVVILFGGTWQENEYVWVLWVLWYLLCFMPRFPNPIPYFMFSAKSHFFQNELDWECVIKDAKTEVLKNRYTKHSSSQSCRDDSNCFIDIREWRIRLWCVYEYVFLGQVFVHSKIF